MRYITLHETQAAYEAVKNALSKPQVAVIKENNDVHYGPLVKVNNVLLNKNELTLAPNATETLVVTVLPVDASDKSVIWSSSDSNVATVSENGVVTAVGNGNATITVTTVDGGFTAQCATEVVVHVSGVSLNKNNLNINQGSSETLVATVLPVDASDKSVTWSSSDNSVATVDSNGVVNGVSSGNATITVTTVDGGYSAQCATEVSVPMIDGHEYVEIGGRKWATMNVGANKVTDYGLYFQWGDTNGYTAAQVGSGSGKKYFGWEDYKYGNGTSSPGATGMTKYNSTDGKTTLDAEDDGVVVNWGGKWRMPTTTELQTLSNAVTSAWTNNYKSTGVAGMVCTAKDGSGAELFFPAAGNCFNGSMRNVGSFGYYWSSSVYSSSVQQAYISYFSNWDVSWQYDGYRRYGRSLRGVVSE